MSPSASRSDSGPRDTIVLEYMQSCWRETITGGQVTIGTELSDVSAGQVERHKVDCDGGRLMLTSTLASQSAGLVVRAMRPQGQGTPPAPQITLYGLSPLIELKGGGTLVIERVDQPGERYEYAVGGEQLLKGAFFDLARVGQALAPGGTYRASVGSRQIVFKIDPGSEARCVAGRRTSAAPRDLILVRKRGRQDTSAPFPKFVIHCGTH